MESTIYINTTLKEARANTAGSGLPEVTLTLLAQWLCHLRFFATDEEPALLASPTFVLAIKETPTGTALVRTETTEENEDGDGYDFDFVQVDGESLRALLADNASLPLVIEIEWTVGGRTERVHVPCTVINAYNRPADVAPDPVAEASETWLRNRALRYDEVQTLTPEQKAQALDNLGITNGVDGASAYEVAVENGFVGTEEEWLDSLVGAQGPQGIQGIQGPPGADSDVVEDVAAVSRVSEFTLGGSGGFDFDGDTLDIELGGGDVLRAWFNVDGMTSPPSPPAAGRLLEIALLSSDDTNAVASKIAAALDATPELSAVAASNTFTVTEPPGYSVQAPVPSDGVNMVLTGGTDGADAYERVRAGLSGELLEHVDAESLGGTPAVMFSQQGHAHNFQTNLTRRPQCKRLATDAVAGSTSLASLTSIGIAVEAGVTYHFDFHGFYSTSNTVEDAGFAMLGPASSNIVVQSEIVTASTGTTSFARNTAWDSTHQTNASTARTNLPFRVSGVFTPTASGTLYPRLKTELSSAGQTSTIHAGAALHVTPVD